MMTKSTKCFVFASMLFTLFLVLVVARPIASFAQVSVNVEQDEPVYRDLEKLIAHGLIKKVIVGQKPYSRREIARMLAEALYYFQEEKAQYSETSSDYIEGILKKLQQEYREELIQLGALKGKSQFFSLHALPSVELDYLGTISPSRTIPNNGIGSIDAQINPLLNNRQGRRLVDGQNLGLETEHWFRLSNHFAVLAQPRLQLAFLRDSDQGDHGVYLENLYGKFYVKNFEIQIGRDQLFWGQGQDAGLLLSNNSRSLDMIKISNDEPFFFPWVFRYMGANKFSFFYADLGPERVYPNPYFVGYKWSLQPLSFFEIGAAVITLGGGEGGPEASLGERVRDVLPFLGSGSSVQISDKMAGVDWRFRIPPARGLEIYGEFIFDDWHNPFKKTKQFFWEDAGYVFGLYAPRLDKAGNVDLRLEYHRTGRRHYQHGQFLSGWTLNQNIMGDPLGPNAQGFYVNLRWDSTKHDLFTFAAAYESRSNDLFVGVAEPEFHFEKLEDRTDERRYRGSFHWQHEVIDFPLRLWTQFSYERVSNFNFVSGQDRNNFLAQVGFKFYLDRWTRF
ncbi:MAG: hypothetical protein H7A32_05255 [Deltaproteobacteria bacterium]|nr:hypothetical protein [Deltaproteobacteria bacterium]